jgi:hypothetical protein
MRDKVTIAAGYIVNRLRLGEATAQRFMTALVGLLLERYTAGQWCASRPFLGEGSRSITVTESYADRSVVAALEAAGATLDDVTQTTKILRGTTIWVDPGSVSIRERDAGDIMRVVEFPVTRGRPRYSVGVVSADAYA